MTYTQKQYYIYQKVQERRTNYDKSNPEVRLREFGETVISRKGSEVCIQRLQTLFPQLKVRHAYDPNAKYLIISI